MAADLGQREKIEPCDLDTLLCRLDRGRHHLRKRKTAEHRMGIAASGDRPWDRGGEEPPLGAIAHGARVAVTARRARAVRLEHVRRRRERCTRGPIEAQEAAAIGCIGRDTGVAAEPAHCRLHHERGERGADQCIERVATLLHDAYAGVGYRRMSTGAHAAFGFDRSTRVDRFATAGTLRHGWASSEHTNQRAPEPPRFRSPTRRRRSRAGTSCRLPRTRKDPGAGERGD